MAVYSGYTALIHPAFIYMCMSKERRFPQHLRAKNGLVTLVDWKHGPGKMDIYCARAFYTPTAQV